jgi:N6-adenosine-specific RNA methylase IME4
MEKIGRPYAHHPDRPATTAEGVRAHREKRTPATVHYLPASREPGVFIMDLDALVASGQQFRCLYADPPWQYSNHATRASAHKHYATLTVDQICALPVKALAAPQAHLHLWTTNAFLFASPAIFDAWGFEFKSSFVWVKPRIGIGNYWRNSHEYLLLGVRGGLTAHDRSLPSWLQADRTLHSEKPEQVRDMVEQFSPGPYLELFGRASVPGWTVWGNECHPANGRLFKESF